MTELRRRMLQDLKIRNLSPRTQEIYLSQVARFAKHFNKSSDLLGPEQIREYQVYLLEERNASLSLLTQTACALRFFYRITLKRDWTIQGIPYPKQPRRLPYVLSQDQVSRLILSPSNIKHRAILMTLYAGGLRISELANLQVHDINSDRMVLTIRCGKGQKDRQVPLSHALLHHLREYWRQTRPRSHWLFPGILPTHPLKRSSIGRVVEHARRAAGLSDKVSAHTLRHCFATHHLESGATIRQIQELLGHASLKTTLIYLHVVKKTLHSINSPLDLLPALSPPHAGLSPQSPQTTQTP